MFAESLRYQPLPCTLSYLSTLGTFEEKYAHIRQCTGARRVHAGMTGGMSHAALAVLNAALRAAQVWQEPDDLLRRHRTTVG